MCTQPEAGDLDIDEFQDFGAIPSASGKRGGRPDETGRGTLNVAKVMGTDVSIGTLSKGLRGLDVLYQNHRIKNWP